MKQIQDEIRKIIEHGAGNRTHITCSKTRKVRMMPVSLILCFAVLLVIGMILYRCTPSLQQIWC
jgi:hypothetical protein